jgi:hypothetical protein
MTEERTYFRLCSSCKRELSFGSPYYVCSVSTCTRKRTGLSFCSVGCFEAHVPILRHREAWAEEQRAPTRAQWEGEQAEEAAKQARSESREAREPVQPDRRVVAVGAGSGASLHLADDGVPRDILIVVSKLKAYIRARSGMNTSDGCTDVLSDIVRELCDSAIRRAAEEGRKTVLDRDF